MYMCRRFRPILKRPYLLRYALPGSRESQFHSSPARLFPVISDSRTRGFLYSYIHCVGTVRPCMYECTDVCRKSNSIFHYSKLISCLDPIYRNRSHTVDIRPCFKFLKRCRYYHVMYICMYELVIFTYATKLSFRIQ
jgi:hypothetical protein